MATAIVATYENGLLKPSKKLPLREHDQVLVVVMPLTPEVEYAPDTNRVAKMREQAEAWLSRQPSNAVREPVTRAPETEQHLDDEFDAALAAIRARARRFDEKQIFADIEAAIAEVRAMTDKERARLDTELNKVLAAIATDAIS